MKVCQGKYTVVIIGDQNSIINFTQFEATIWAKHKTQWRWSKFLKIMNLVFGLNDENMTTLEKNTDNVIKLYKCNRCEYASSHKGNLRIYLKKHSGEMPYKCNQCDFASSYKSALRTHLKMHI